MYLLFALNITFINYNILNKFHLEKKTPSLHLCHQNSPQTTHNQLPTRSRHTFASIPSLYKLVRKVPTKKAGVRTLLALQPILVALLTPPDFNLVEPGGISWAISRGRELCDLAGP